MKEKIELPRAKAFGFQRFAELAGELACITGNCLSRADRLGKHTAYLDEVRRAYRINRFAEGSHGLIETAAKFGTKAQGERRAGFCREFADAREAEDGQILHHGFGQTKGGDGQAENGLRAVSRRDDEGWPRPIAGHGMGGAPAVGDRRPRRDARCGKPRDHFL